MIANPSVVIRTGPSTTYKVIGAVPYRTRISVICTRRGKTMRGPYGRTNLWNKVSYRGKKGYITDAFLFTGTSGAIAPACKSGQANASSAERKRVAKYAKSMEGRSGWNNWCEAWVEHVWGGKTGRHASAIAHYRAKRGSVHTTGTPPAGAVVFYAAARVNHNWGHAMISLGGGRYVTTASKIRIVGKRWPGARYLGWYLPR